METACAPFFICERTHFYSSLFTFPSESPVFIGIPRGEEFAATLHPLFTTLHHSVSADLQFAAVWVTIADLKSAIRAYSGLAPVRQCSCRAYQEGVTITRVTPFFIILTPRCCISAIAQLVEQRTDIVYKLALWPRFDSWWHHNQKEPL